MAVVTFGQMLRIMLNKKGLSAQKLAERIYGKGHNNRTQIERWLALGNPTDFKKKEITTYSLRLLVAALEASYSEEIYLYGLAGKLPPVQMPTQSQLNRVLEQCSPVIARHPYPAYVIDSRHMRFWMANEALVNLVGGVQAAEKLSQFSVFQMAFDRRLPVYSMLGDHLETIQRQQIRRYMLLNLNMRHEEYYMAFPEAMCKILDAESYAFFEQKWVETSKEIEEDRIGNTAMVKIDFHTGGVKSSFLVIVEPILALAPFFSIVRYIPIGENADSIMPRPEPGEVFKSWQSPGSDLPALLHDDPVVPAHDKCRTANKQTVVR